jgi:dTDP-4-amino-4,6-dideoxygalactose transaminase
MSEYKEATNFIDLEAQQNQIRPDLEKSIKKVLDHGQYIMGPEVKFFEEDLKKFTGAKHALTCANGTDALSIVLMSWGIGPGHAVFVPSFTYVASAEAPAQLGATPFFVDVVKDTFNIDPNSFKQAIIDCKNMGLKPSVVIAVDLFGQPADVEAITEIAMTENIKVLVDGAQSFGAAIDGNRVGSMGDATTTSFFPAKPLGCYGDGGAILTNNDENASTINSIRLHGKGIQKYDNVRIGLNSRLDTIQAAILIEKLKIFEKELDSRNKIASRYTNSLIEYVKVPEIPSNITSAWAQYTLTLEGRDKLQQALKLKGIPSVIYYPIPLSKQKGYSHYPTVSSGVSNSEQLALNVLSLPMHPYMNKSSQEFIINEVISNI